MQNNTNTTNPNLTDFLSVQIKEFVNYEIWINFIIMLVYLYIMVLCLLKYYETSISAKIRLFTFQKKNIKQNKMNKMIIQ